MLLVPLSLCLKHLLRCCGTVMKNSIYKEKFKATNFVKPLYKVNFAKVTPKLFRDIDRTNLVGDAYVTNNVSNITFKETQRYKILPGACEEKQHYNLRCDKDRMEEQNDEDLSKALKAISSSKNPTFENEAKHNPLSDPLQVTSDVEAKTEETWLRVHPAPVLADESYGSVIFRFMACQLGITVFIIVWTCLWVAVIQSYEGPHENFVTKEFEKQQNQLVIDLATELRMVAPLSPRWKKVIYTRIEEARLQTMIAAGRGAKLVPGRYWNLPGTFLFTVYVMTALGFGAPVPQTNEGRCFALLYAVFAVPFHVYLMMQASTCAVAHVNYYLEQCHKSLKRPRKLKHPGNKRDNQDHTNIEVKTSRRRKKLSHLVAVVTAGHCVPVASILYYVIGVAIFGFGRQQDSHNIVDVLMFPLQFTTNGGLAMVESHFRILYALYVEGAMALLTCALAAARRRSGNSVGQMVEKHRLYTKL